MIWNIPNILTVLRLIAAPLVAILFLYFDRPYADFFALFLFLIAAITDWFDGYLARAWRQQTKIGAMLDPIADKAMVVIALAVIIGFSDAYWTPWLVLPATVILFREVFVSGLREYLGDVAGTLKVTQLAKWKTTVQMLAIAFLFSRGVFEHYYEMHSTGLDQDPVDKSMAAAILWSGRIGFWLLWLAAALTAISGIDYFRKALPHLKEGV